MKDNHRKLIETFETKSKNASDHFRANHARTLDLIENTILKFATFFIALSEVEQNKRNYYYKGYISSITNNFVVTKKLFEEGWHFQLQIISRTQYEQLQNLLAILFDDSYFEYHSKTQNDDEIIPITPKQVHINKTIAKIIKEDKIYGNLLKELTKGMKPLYDEFSKAAHGNFMQAILLSSYHMNKDDVILDVGSVQNAYERTENYLISLLEYAQVIWFICNKKFNDLEIFELTNLSDEFKIHLIKK